MKIEDFDPKKVVTGTTGSIDGRKISSLRRLLIKLDPSLKKMRVMAQGTCPNCGLLHYAVVEFKVPKRNYKTEDINFPSKCVSCDNAILLVWFNES